MKLQQIFYRYDDIPIEQLARDTNLGYTVELAIRTNDAEICKRALMLDSADTYDLIYQLAIVPDEQLTEFLGQNGDRLALALTLGRTLPVEFNVPIYNWLIDRALNRSTSFLHNVLLSLDYLRRHIINERSSWYYSLVDFGYSKRDIMYLNYEFLHNYVDENMTLKLSQMVISAYFSATKQLDLVQEIVVISILEPYFDRNSVFNSCAFAVNEENWLFALRLARDGYLSIESEVCRISILNGFYSERAENLLDTERMSMLDYDVLKYQTKGEVLKALRDCSCDDYLSSLDRSMNDKTLGHLLELGILDIANVGEKQLLRYIGNVDTKKKFDAFMHLNSVNSQWLKKLGFSNFTTQPVNLYRSFLEEYDNRQFAVRVMQLVYEWLGKDFIFFISRFMGCPDNSRYFSKEELLLLLKKVIELFPEYFSMHYQHYVESVILDDTDYCKLQSQRFQELEMLKVTEKSKQLDEYFKQVSRQLSEIATFEELFEYVNVHLDDCFPYEKTLIPLVLKQFVLLRDRLLTVDVFALRVLIILFQYHSISFSQFQYFLCDREVSK